MAGRLLVYKYLGTQNGNVHERIPVKGLAKGLYLFQIRLDGEQVTRKLWVGE
jgi:hypothetical protein